MGKDHTLFALIDGTVVFKKKMKNRSYISVEPVVDVDVAVAEAPAVTEKPAKKEVKTEKPVAETEGDDLKRIEGIGPKIAEIFNAAGISTYADLAATPVEKLSEILAEAGSRYASKNPATWPEQAKLAAEGNWDVLKDLQEKLKGGIEK
jgi:large subunit ribosomal protein L27